MTDLHDENTDAPEAHGDEEPVWTPPDTLSPPPSVQSRPPLFALGLALGVSVAAGVALWISSQAIYFYILYNALIGGALGWALSFAPKRAGFTSKTALLVPGVALAALPYVLLHVFLSLQVLSNVQAEAPEVTFGAVFLFLLENNTLFDIEIGLLGSIALFLAEVGITVVTMHGRLVQGLAEARMASVPGDVIDFVVHGLAEGWDTPRLRDELSRRGWRSAADQDRAIGTGFDVIAALQAQAA